MTETASPKKPAPTPYPRLDRILGRFMEKPATWLVKKFGRPLIFSFSILISFFIFPAVLFQSLLVVTILLILAQFFAFVARIGDSSSQKNPMGNPFNFFFISLFSFTALAVGTGFNFTELMPAALLFLGTALPISALNFFIDFNRSQFSEKDFFFSKEKPDVTYEKNSFVRGAQRKLAIINTPAVVFLLSHPSIYLLLAFGETYWKSGFLFYFSTVLSLFYLIVLLYKIGKKNLF